jgi:hypothetical protein
MLRQKRYHDLKLSWQKFENGDEAYVYFPVRKTEHSSKLTSYWRGPFKVLEKCTDVTYRVECGNKGKSQIIHVDRMRKRNPQILGGETEQPSDLQVFTQIAMNNNPSSKRVGVVFFTLRLSYRLSDLIVRMGSFLQLIPDFHFPFELLHHSSLEKN